MTDTTDSKISGAAAGARPRLQLEDLRCVTAIGGGHGLGRVLSTLSFLQRRLVGIVATTDNGGASGLLRRSQQTIAWGDIRNCMSQLALQPLAADVLNYRFSDEHELNGHNFGNLLLHTLDQLSARPLDGIQLLSRLLNISIRLLPMSETPVDLVASTHEGLECFGELDVDQLHHMPTALTLAPAVAATPEALRHIRRSDLIMLGPGSFLTSVMPPLLMADLAQSIADSHAPVIFIDNLSPEYSPAGRLDLSERINWLEQQLGRTMIDLVITNAPDEKLTVPYVRHVAAARDARHRHDRDSLLNAIKAAVELLHTKIPSLKGNDSV
ncbi:uridine diphosphate-N-acetylglucosamine-binding protein YvcK [Pseudidiomarina sp.]|uniref:uridine diphosphate-N-acetylglucosamine-binding protein YvcK n=1 Tax=Pseudidiomarina sp. TaxID=2081707 RepID=UPI00299EB667|nr:uridine diphosphate-N-acetylglucosamine-binding protein YvcK [Pseudidiomarina sp.]MDX1705490.1 uridine diphosphate-N-acetylglucosamine-binding protein YvcK [Pseudidiomarina sp.]